jgi:hypothetical protein
MLYIVPVVHFFLLLAYKKMKQARKSNYRRQWPTCVQERRYTKVARTNEQYKEKFFTRKLAKLTGIRKIA